MKANNNFEECNEITQELYWYTVTEEIVDEEFELGDRIYDLESIREEFEEKLEKICGKHYWI